MTPLLISEPPLQVIPSLAVAVGLNGAIVLQQIHYWSIRSTTVIGGHRWVYNTVQQWRWQFPFWSDDTISRTLKDLRERGLVIADRLGSSAFDRTLYYRIDYPALSELTADSAASNAATCGVLNAASCGNGVPQSAGFSNKTETTTETPESVARKRAPRPQKAEAVDEAWLAANCSIPVDTGSAWLALRKAKRLPLTFKAWELTVQDGASVGLTAEQTVTECVRRGWAAFRADWWQRDQHQTRGQETFRERDARLAAERVREMTGGLGHDRAALGDSSPLPFEHGYVPPQDVIEGGGHARRIR